MKMKEPHATSKGPPQTLIGHCSISDAMNEVMLRVGRRRGPQLGISSGSTPEELVRRERQLRGLEMAGRLLGSSPTQLLVRMAAEVGPSTLREEAGHIRPIIGGMAPCKEF